MFLIQAGIGSANDLIDADADAQAKPWKPLAAGLVTERIAERVVSVALAGGLVLSALSGVPVFAVAIAGAGIGLLYDLRLKGTPYSWLPFALGIPLLPVYGWLGSGMPLPAGLFILVALAVPAGAALAVANAVADVRSDGSAGVGSVATTLGRARAWGIGALLQAFVVLVALGTVLPESARPLVSAGGIASAAAVAVGLGLGRTDDPRLATRGWELQALGLGCLAVVWLVGRPALA